MLLKGVGMLTILIATSLFGYSLSSEYLTRIKNLEQMKKTLLFLKGEILHNNAGIRESIIKVALSQANVMGDFLKKVELYFTENECSIKEAWDEGLDQIVAKKTCLDNEDVLLLKDLGNCLGVTDRETQVGNILNTMDVIQIRINELNDVRGEKCKLYRTLGVMAGVFMVIVLI